MLHARAAQLEAVCRYYERLKAAEVETRWRKGTGNWIDSFPG